MTPEDFRAALSQVGLTVYASAGWLGISLSTAYRYAEGKAAIPEPTAKLLRLVARLGIDPADVI